MTTTAAQLVHLALTTGVTVKMVTAARRPDLSRLLRDGILAETKDGYVSGPALHDALDVPE